MNPIYNTKWHHLAIISTTRYNQRTDKDDKSVKLEKKPSLEVAPPTTLAQTTPQSTNELLIYSSKFRSIL